MTSKTRNKVNRGLTFIAICVVVEFVWIATHPGQPLVQKRPEKEKTIMESSDKGPARVTGNFQIGIDDGRQQH